MKRLVGIALTHRNLPLDLIGKLHLDPEFSGERLKEVKEKLGLSELLYLSTCNRVEFLLVTDVYFDHEQLYRLLSFMVPELAQEEVDNLVVNAERHYGEETIRHLLRVASSLDSMVIGEREIITQVRQAFEHCKKNGLTGDTIRLAIRKTVETAKKIFTETDIFKKPVSVVSLAYHRLKELNIDINSRIIIIGAGQTIKNMTRFLNKHGFKNLVIFNRTIDKAELLALEVNGRAFPLSALPKYKGGFDVIISCTSATEPIIDTKVYHQLLNGDKGNKVIIDLAVPSDVHPDVAANNNVKMIDVSHLKLVAAQNLKERERDVVKCEEIIDVALEDFRSLYRIRQVELAMQGIPQEVKKIKTTALEAVFAKDLQKLDPGTREVLDQVLDYMEKKYISVPMKMAREVMLNQK